MPERTRFGNFLLHEKLAVGGMGELYLATRSDRRSPPLAIKILIREFRENPEFVAMFRDEARIGMRLSHRNIVGVHEVGAIDSTPYIVLEYVHGENLRAVLRSMLMAGERVPPELAVKIAIDVLLGLEHAHRAKDENGVPLRLVHRDLSPDNILLSYEGEVKILDFGIAKAEGRSTQTQVGVVKGKPQYMSPEQANVMPVDARSDLFALALVLLEVLTGEKRFSHEDHLAQQEAARTWEPTVPSAKVAGLPRELDTILLKALQSDPDLRWDGADHFASALTRLARSGQLPRARETLPAFLARLFPDGAAKRFDADEVTVLRPAVEAPEPDLSAPPRWSSDDAETRLGAQNLAQEQTVDAREHTVDLEKTATAEGSSVDPRATYVASASVAEATIRTAKTGSTGASRGHARGSDSKRNMIPPPAQVHASAGRSVVPRRRPGRRRRGALRALVLIVPLVAAVAGAVWHFQEVSRRPPAPGASPEPSSSPPAVSPSATRPRAVPTGTPVRRSRNRRSKAAPRR